VEKAGSVLATAAETGARTVYHVAHELPDAIEKGKQLYTQGKQIYDTGKELAEGGRKVLSLVSAATGRGESASAAGSYGRMGPRQQYIVQSENDFLHVANDMQRRHGGGPLTITIVHPSGHELSSRTFGANRAR
jgi:hypothetical protein